MFIREEGLRQEGSRLEPNLELCLVGRFLTDRSIRLKTMVEVMANVWRPGRRVTITEVEKGFYLFQFYHRLDMERVTNDGPWSFDNHLLVLGRVQLGVVMSHIPLFHVAFWVQADNLPLGFMTTTVGTYLGNYVGSFMEYDKSNNANLWRKYMRLRVLIDVRVPLKKERKVKMQGGEWSTMSFKYERLGVFCFLCGLLGHNDQLCDHRFTLDNDNGRRNWGVEAPDGDKEDRWRRWKSLVEGPWSGFPTRESENARYSGA